MRRRFVPMILFILIIGAITPQLPAAIIDFESLQHGGSSSTITMPRYSEDGYTIRGEVGLSNAFAAWGTASPDFAGSTGLFGNVALSITLTKDNGGEFDFNAISLSHLFDLDPGIGNSRLKITFRGTRADSSVVTRVFDEPRFFGFQEVSFTGFTSLVSLNWDQSAFGSAPHQFDNVNVTATQPPPPLPPPPPPPPVQPIPEPSTILVWTFLGLFLAGVRWWQRR